MSDRVLIVGGGAAGLMAAGRAAECGARVLLVEKRATLGNKLALAGNGRGNLTNVADVEEHVRRLGPTGAFARNCLYRFGPQEAQAFWRGEGLPLVVEGDGRVFPRSGVAGDAVERLVAYARRHGAAVRSGAAVREVLVAEGRVRGVRLADGEEIVAESVVLATGGWSYSRTGSSGDGWRIAAALGHTVHPPVAGLVPLVTADAWPRSLQGLSLPDVALEARRNGREAAWARGGLVFTHYGLSGPAVLALSLSMARLLTQGPVDIWLDLAPARADDALADVLRRGAGTLRGALRVMLPRALADALLAQSALPADLRLAEMGARRRAEAVALVKRVRLVVERTRPLREAMVTVGGVDVAEVEPTTMASRLVPGLYLAGEVLDVAGETGGYNLQFALASGRLAGESAARGVCRDLARRGRTGSPHAT